MADPIRLYHYTCGHSAPQITTSGHLRPHPQSLLGGIPLVWLTDLDQPDRSGLGLTSQILRCDRTEYRATVRTDAAARWTAWARRLSRAERDRLEDYPGALPMHWWVSELLIPVLSVEPVSGAEAGR